SVSRRHATSPTPFYALSLHDALPIYAGMGMVGAVEDSTKDDIWKLFNLNLVGAVQLMSAVLPAMRAQKNGQIINISSIGSEMGRSEEHTSELQSRENLVCRLLLEKKK